MATALSSRCHSFLPWRLMKRCSVSLWSSQIAQMRRCKRALRERRMSGHG